MENNQNLLTAELQVDTIAYVHLRETAKWAKFLAILGFIICGFILIVALFAGTFFSALSGGLGGSAALFGTGVISAIYILVGAIYFALSLFLFRFANKMSIALQSSDQDNFNVALHNLKLVYRIMGIIVIAYLVLMFLVLVFSLMR